MTVKDVKESGGGISGSDSEKLKGFFMMDGGRKKIWDHRLWMEEVDDQESGGSEEEFESPKSVAKVGKWTKNIACVHSQVLRIREEDLHLGEDIGEGLSAKDKVSGHHHHHVASQMDVVFLSRPILPSSPLSGKTPIKT